MITDILNGKSILIGNRIPNDFFITKGVGESDIAIHAGSYHLALQAAGIESFNIMNYSSILPKNAKQIVKPDNLIHGSVMESITAVMNVNSGTIGSAGIIYGWLYDRNNDKHGGLVCETTGNTSTENISNELNASLLELYQGYSDRFELKDITLITNSFTPKKKYGTVLVGICFVNYLVSKYV